MDGLTAGARKQQMAGTELGRRDQVNRTRNANHAARTRERFVYSIVRITRLMIIIHEARKGIWAFFLDRVFLVADWLGRQTPIT